MLLRAAVGVFSSSPHVRLERSWGAQLTSPLEVTRVGGSALSPRHRHHWPKSSLSPRQTETRPERIGASPRFLCKRHASLATYYSRRKRDALLPNALNCGLLWSNPRRRARAETGEEAAPLLRRQMPSSETKDRCLYPLSLYSKHSINCTSTYCWNKGRWGRPAPPSPGTNYTRSVGPVSQPQPLPYGMS
eukprot:scaffold157851_cov33-Tisochrysis_lutea.AAC.4